MSNSEAIYRLRQQIDGKRQPIHADNLRILHQCVVLNGERHPFTPKQTTFQSLAALSAYSPAGMGLAGYCAGEYLYRLCSLRSIVDFVTEWAAPVPRESSDQELHQFLRSEQRSPDGWLRLDVYAGGVLSGYRSITWWTGCSDLANVGDTLASAHRCGLPNNWIGVHVAVLRLKLDASGIGDLPRVPTVLDAFTSEIFHATKDLDHPRAGITIDLRQAPELAPGVDEYVLPEVPVANLMLRPLLLTRRSPSIRLNPGLRDSLLSYYEGLRDD